MVGDPEDLLSKKYRPALPLVEKHSTGSDLYQNKALEEYPIACYQLKWRSEVRRPHLR